METKETKLKKSVRGRVRGPLLATALMAATLTAVNPQKNIGAEPPSSKRIEISSPTDYTDNLAYLMTEYNTAWHNANENSIFFANSTDGINKGAYDNANATMVHLDPNEQSTKDRLPKYDTVLNFLWSLQTLQKLGLQDALKMGKNRAGMKLTPEDISDMSKSGPGHLYLCIAQSGKEIDNLKEVDVLNLLCNKLNGTLFDADRDYPSSNSDKEERKSLNMKMASRTNMRAYYAGMGLDEKDIDEKLGKLKEEEKGYADNAAVDGGRYIYASSAPQWSDYGTQRMRMDLADVIHGAFRLAGEKERTAQQAKDETGRELGR
jgi:hypothetical protein